MNDRLIEKLRKLLAMSQDKSSENEAMIAAKQLHALLAKHNLSLDDLQDTSETIDAESATYVCRPWKRIVAINVGRLYFCEFVYMKIGGNKAVYSFIGKEHNRMFASAIFSMIVSTVERESRIQSRKIYGKDNPSFVNSFWTGASIRIKQRCQELIDMSSDGKLEDEDGNILPALVNVYSQCRSDNEDWMASAYTNIKTKSVNTRVTNMEGLRKGKETGDKVQLSRAIQSQAAPKLLS